MTVGQAACQLLCQYILKARWLRRVLAESYRLLCVNQAKKLVVDRILYAPDQ